MLDCASLDLFMMCRSVRRDAFAPPPAGIHMRRIRPGELDAWKRLIADDPGQIGFLDDYYRDVYAPQGDRFLERCLFACDEDDTPVGTCFLWHAYGMIETLHWFKVRRDHEGQGIGRALLSAVLAEVAPRDLPIYLHTHPGSLRAIKLYSDMGFALLRSPARIGSRDNGIPVCLPYLRENMTAEAFRGIAFDDAPARFLYAAALGNVNEF